jgi:hypothetical protein
VLVGLIFVNITITNFIFDLKNVVSWAIVCHTKVISVSMFLLIEFISLEMFF